MSADVRIESDGRFDVRLDGAPVAAGPAGTPDQARMAVVGVLRQIAHDRGTVIEADTVNEDGSTSRLSVHPDGHVQELAQSEGAPAVPNAAPPVPRSFLTQTQVEEPAREGWRGVLTRLGLRMVPGEAERAMRADVLAVSQHWPGPRTIVVANLKGGAGKTPTVCLLSAVFARHGGAGVVGHEGNHTAGTMPWRTSRGAHAATARDVLDRADQLLSTHSQSADMARFVHHQADDKYDVLWADPVKLGTPGATDAPRFGPAEMDRIHRVLCRYYRLVVIDTGNDESDAFWARAVEIADQLVVVTTCQEDRAESARQLIEETLPAAGGRFAELAREAVVIVSQAHSSGSLKEATDLAGRFQAREAIAIPFDPAMVSGKISYAALRPATQRAWLRAGAAVARGLTAPRTTVKQPPR